jgi:deoxyadenosine/deoxycytidine kinase
MAFVCVDANIGSGKTTLLEKLRNVTLSKPHIVLMEPVEEWLANTDGTSGESLFEKYYKDKKRYGFLFQMYALETRMKHMYQALKEHPDKIIVCERSHLTDCYIFANMLLQEGFMEKQEYYVYHSWFEWCCTLLTSSIKGIIYLQADPQISLQRIFKRMRKGEETISYNYIDTLHKLHENWLIEKPQPDISVCVVNANVEEDQLDVASIVEFINKTTS